MKKIFTLLVCASIATASFAQETGNRDFARNNNVAYRDRHDRDDRRSGNFYYFSRKELNMQVSNITQDFERRICIIKEKRFMRPYRKQLAIRQLEAERDLKIADLNERFHSKFNKFNNQHWNNW